MHIKHQTINYSQHTLNYIPNGFEFKQNVHNHLLTLIIFIK